MAEKEEQKDTEAGQSTKQEGSPELNVFVKLLPAMKLQLELSIESVSTKLWCEQVITEEVHDRIFDDTYQGSAHRTAYFLKRIYKRIKKANKQGNLEEGRRIITRLASALRDDAALAPAAKEIDECNNSEGFRKIMDSISSTIDGSILPIAGKMFSEKIITDTEHDLITDPSAKHSAAVTNVVFKAVRVAIETDPNNLDKLREILLSMGPPISILGTKIEEELPRPQYKMKQNCHSHAQYKMKH